MYVISNNRKTIISTGLQLLLIFFISCVSKPITIENLNNNQQPRYDLTKAYSLIEKGNCIAAIPLLQESLDFYKKNTSILFSECSILLGDCYQKTKQYEKSEQAYQDALQFDQQQFGRKNAYVARDYNRLATLFLEKSAYYRSLMMIDQAIAIDRKRYGQAHFDTARDLTLKAILYERLGQYNKAISIQEMTLAIIKKKFGPRHEYTSAAINNLGASCLRLKNYEKATSFFEKALTIDQSLRNNNQGDIARDLNNLGIVYRKTGKYEKAQNCFQKAFEIYRKLYGPLHSSVSAALNNIGNTQIDLKQYAAAEISFSKALIIAQALRDKNLSWHIWDGLRNLFSAQQKIQLAIFFGKQAVLCIQDLRNSFSHMPQDLLDSFLLSKADVYRSLADLFIQEGRLAEAQWVLRMLKEEEYFQVTFSSTASRGGNVKTSQIIFSEFEQSWKKQFQNIQNQLISISKEYQFLLDRDQNETITEKEMDRLDYLETVLDKNQEYVHQYINQLICSFDHISDFQRQKELSSKQLNTIKGMKHTLKQMGNDVVLIHYIVMSDCVHIILTTPDIQIARKSLIDIHRLNQTVFTFRKAIEERHSYLQEAQLLYQWLIAPIEKDLKQANAKVLMLSLDEMLRYVPFCALHTGTHHLTQRYQTSVYTEAARDKIKILPDRSGKIAGVGLSNACPHFNLPALHAVPEEIEAIVIHGQDDPIGLLNGIVYLNESFSYKNFRRILRKRYSYLHIASHFVLIPGDEKSSFLILGDQTTINLLDIEKKCDFNGIQLLTLSACNTAMGSKGHSGREIEGFGALAQNNGAQSVLASLWEVNDRSTGEFMQKFYRYFVQGKLTSKAWALQQAQLHFLNHPSTDDYKHPFFWAPFILMGNWR